MGSEICIRDRYRAAECPGQILHFYVHPLLVAVKGQGGAGRGMSPLTNPGRGRFRNLRLSGSPTRPLPGGEPPQTSPTSRESVGRRIQILTRNLQNLENSELTESRKFPIGRLARSSKTRSGKEIPRERHRPASTQNIVQHNKYQNKYLYQTTVFQNIESETFIQKKHS